MVFSRPSSIGTCQNFEGCAAIPRNRQTECIGDASGIRLHALTSQDRRARPQHRQFTDRGAGGGRRARRWRVVRVSGWGAVIGCWARRWHVRRFLEPRLAPRRAWAKCWRASAGGWSDASCTLDALRPAPPAGARCCNRRSPMLQPPGTRDQQELDAATAWNARPDGPPRQDPTRLSLVVGYARLCLPGILVIIRLMATCKQWGQHSNIGPVARKWLVTQQH